MLYDVVGGYTDDFLALPYTTLSAILIFIDKQNNNNEFVFAVNAQAQKQWSGLIM